MKILAPEIHGVKLPENLKWITLNNHSFKDLISREVSAIEEEISHLELVKKTIIKKRKQEEKDLAVITSLYKATESSLRDPQSKRVLLFKRLKKGKTEKKDHPKDHGKKAGNKKSKAKDSKVEEEEGEEEGDDSDNEEKDDEGSDKEEHKKRKYVILVKKCQCCGLEVKRHNCKHILCSKPCTIEEKQVSKKKPK